MNMTHLPFFEFLSGALALDGAPALCDDKSEGWVRYGDLREHIKKLTPFFRTPTQEQKRGLILCALPRMISGCLGYLAAAASGHALVMIDPATTRLDPFLVHYQPNWLLLSSPQKPVGPYIPVDFGLDDLYLWKRTLDDTPQPHPDLFILLLPPGPPDAFKTVRLSYHAIAHNTLASLQAVNLDARARPLLMMPLAYSFGLSLLHMVLSVGGSLFLTEKDIKDRELWNIVQRRDVTHFAGVPFHFEYLTRARLDNLRVPKLKSFLQAGGRMPLERTQEMLSQTLERAGELFILYGLTEASPRIACLPLHLYPDKARSIGKPVKDGHITSDDGVLTYHGPNVMMGYAESREDLTKGDMQQGRLTLPEPGRQDEDGFWFLGS